MRIDGPGPDPQAKIPRKCKWRESLASGRKGLSLPVTKSGPISGATVRKRLWKDVRKGDARDYPAKPGKLSADIENICEGHSFQRPLFLGEQGAFPQPKRRGRMRNPRGLSNPVPNGVLSSNRANHASPRASREQHGKVHNPAHSLQAACLGGAQVAEGFWWSERGRNGSRVEPKPKAETWQRSSEGTWEADQIGDRVMQGICGHPFRAIGAPEATRCDSADAIREKEWNLDAVPATTHPAVTC
jgi:hypothetical protein